MEYWEKGGRKTWEASQIYDETIEQVGWHSLRRSSEVPAWILAKVLLKFYFYWLIICLSSSWPKQWIEEGILPILLITASQESTTVLAHSGGAVNTEYMHVLATYIHWWWQQFSQNAVWHRVSVHCGKGAYYFKTSSSHFLMGSRTQALFHTGQNCSLVSQRPANLTVVLKCKFCMSFNYWKPIWSLCGLTHSWFLFTVKGQRMVNKSCKQFSIFLDEFLSEMTESNNKQ